MLKHIEKFLLFLNRLEMEIPKPWGWFHLLWIVITIAFVLYFCYAKKNHIEIPPNRVYAIYGFGAFALELTKQLMWSVSSQHGHVTWDYSWYAAPFQLCTTPMFVCIALCFIRNVNWREALESYLGYISIFNTFLAILLPESCFVEDILIDIHTMFLHCGGFVVGAFALIEHRAQRSLKGLAGSYCVFLAFVAVALLLDIGLMKLGVVTVEDAFNMFYLSPYIPCPLPVLSSIYNAVPYPVFLLAFVAAFFLIGLLINRVYSALTKEL